MVGENQLLKVSDLHVYVYTHTYLCTTHTYISTPHTLICHTCINKGNINYFKKLLAAFSILFFPSLPYLAPHPIIYVLRQAHPVLQSTLELSMCPKLTCTHDCPYKCWVYSMKTPLNFIILFRKCFMVCLEVIVQVAFFFSVISNLYMIMRN